MDLDIDLIDDRHIEAFEATTRSKLSNTLIQRKNGNVLKDNALLDSNIYNIRESLASQTGDLHLAFSLIQTAWNLTIGHYWAFQLFKWNVAFTVLHLVQGFVALILSVVKNLTPQYRAVNSDFTQWDKVIQMFTVFINDIMNVNVGAYLAAWIIFLGLVHFALTLQSWVFYNYYSTKVKSTRESWHFSAGYVEMLRDRAINWQRWVFFGMFFANWNVVVFLVYGDQHFFFMFTLASLTVLAFLLLLMTDLLQNSSDPISCFYYTTVLTNPLSNIEGSEQEDAGKFVYRIVDAHDGEFSKFTETYNRSDEHWWGLVVSAIVGIFILVVQFVYFIRKVSSHQAEWVNYVTLPLTFVSLAVLLILLVLHYIDKPRYAYSTKEIQEQLQTTIEGRYSHPIANALIKTKLLFFQHNQHRIDAPPNPFQRKPSKFEKQTGRPVDVVQERVKQFNYQWTKLGDRFVFEIAILIWMAASSTAFLWITIGGIIKQSPV